MDKDSKHLQAKRIEYREGDPACDWQEYHVGKVTTHNRGDDPTILIRTTAIEILEMAAGFIRFIVRYEEVGPEDGEVSPKASPKRFKLQSAWAGSYAVSGIH